MHPLDQPKVPRDPTTDALFKAAEEAHEAARKQFTDACKAHDKAHERLIYAAGARCRCGAGLAYLNTAGIHGEWRCSDRLKAAHNGERPVLMDGHDEPLPFAFYEVKSELQPSANGATTRPTE